MTERSAPALPFRIGCPLALLIGAALALAEEWLPYASQFDWESYAFETAYLGAPFGVLALARVRDWLAWLSGVALTIAVWGYLAYDLSLHPGVDFAWGFVFLLTPLAIAGVCLAVAAMRGRIPDLWDVPVDDTVEGQG